MKTGKRLVTVYSTSEFFGNVTKLEGTLVKFGTQPYAQYKNCPFIHIIPKGKRNPIGFLKSYKPYLILLEGVGYPEPQNIMGTPLLKNDLEISKSRYRSFDERYRTEFDEVINTYIDKNPENVLMDFRDTMKKEFVKTEEAV